MDENWDFIVIDDLFWSFGFALTTKKHQIWEKKGKEGNEPKIILYSTAAQGLQSAASMRSLSEGERECLNIINYSLHRSKLGFPCSISSICAEQFERCFFTE
jgi:hypothetical protein